MDVPAPVSCRSRVAWRRALGCLVLIALAGTWLPGCSTVARPYRLASITTSDELRPSLVSCFYSVSDANTFDLYLTDLPPAALRPGASLAGVSGHLVRIHVFVVPRAGRTPIDTDAFNAAVTHVIVSSGQIGVYAGGGFVIPENSIGASELRARLAGGTVRFEAGTSGFTDRLGASTVSGMLRTTRNPSMAETAKARLDELARQARGSGAIGN